MNSIPRRPTSLEYRLKTLLTPLRKKLVLIGTEKYSTLKIPFATKLKAWRLGFTSQSYALYDLGNKDPENYLRDFSDINYVLNNPGAHSLSDKFTFARVLANADIPTPEVLALINSGAIVWCVQSGGVASEDRLRAGLEALLKSHNKLVLRPTFGDAGFGVFFLEYHDGALTIDSSPAELSDIVSFIGDQGDYLITKFVEQAGYAKRICPDVTNTIRVLTIWDSEENGPVITNVAHRIGSRQSFPLDNFHGGLGGICAPVDIESGELGPAVSLSKHGQLSSHDKHPETGGQIAGIQIPNWQQVKAMILEAATLYAVSPYIGWDIVITENGCSFVEGNSPPGPAVLQVHGPLLADARLKRFYREHGMLPREA